MHIFVSFVLLPFLVEEYRLPLLIETLLVEPSSISSRRSPLRSWIFSDQLFHASLRFAEIVVSELSPLAFDFARQLFQFSLCLIGILQLSYRLIDQHQLRALTLGKMSNSEAIRIKPRSARLLIRPCK